MASANQVILLGHLGADPDLRYLPDGTPVAASRVATTETWKDQATGEKREQTEWRRLSTVAAGGVKGHLRCCQPRAKGHRGTRAAGDSNEHRGSPDSGLPIIW